MTEKVVTYNSATVALKRATVRSQMQAGVIYTKLEINAIHDDDFGMMNSYVKLLTQTEITGDIGFTLPNYHDTSEVLKAGYETYMDQPRSFFNDVIVPLSYIDDPVTEDALQPDTDQKKG